MRQDWKARALLPSLLIKRNIIHLMLNYSACQGYICFGVKSESFCFLLNNKKHTAVFSRGVTQEALNGCGFWLHSHQLEAPQQQLSQAAQEPVWNYDRPQAQSSPWKVSVDQSGFFSDIGWSLEPTECCCLHTFIENACLLCPFQRQQCKTALLVFFFL